MEERRELHNRGRRSLFGPLILIAAGVIFLLSNLGIVAGDVWENLVRFWPLLLIAIGLDSIYRGEGIVGAAFMIGVGTVFLLANLGYLALNVWSLILRLWPLLLVAIGFDIIIGRRSWAASLIGLVVILALLAGALWLFGFQARGQAVAGEQVSQPLQGAARARVALEPGAGALHVDALPDSQNLIAGTVSSRSGLEVNQDFSQDGDSAEYALRSSGVTMIYFGNAANRWDWDLGLAPQFPLDLRVNMGAGEVEIDLSGLELSSLAVSLGVGRAEVILPEEAGFDGKIDSAIGQVVVVVPEGVGVRIDTNPALAFVSAPESFQKQDDVYTSPGYETAEQQIDLEVGQAIGNITIVAGAR
jgi:hypothetical protein